MRRVLCILLLFSNFANGQSIKILDNLDSTFVGGNSFIEIGNHFSFFESGIGETEIDLENLDQQLLNAALHFSINRLRETRSKKGLIYNPDLEFLAYNCVRFYSASRFKGVKKGRDKYERMLYMASRNLDLKQNMISTNVAYVDILNAPSRKQFYKSREESLPGFYYVSDSKKDPAKDEKVPNCTYNELVDKILEIFLKNGNRAFLLSNSFEISACYVLLDPQSLGRNSPPKFKVIQVVAGKRLSVDD